MLGIIAPAPTASLRAKTFQHTVIPCQRQLLLAVHVDGGMFAERHVQRTLL